jgi:hypothetical protein
MKSLNRQILEEINRRGKKDIVMWSFRLYSLWSEAADNDDGMIQWLMNRDGKNVKTMEDLREYLDKLDVMR